MKRTTLAICLLVATNITLTVSLVETRSCVSSQSDRDILLERMRQRKLLGDLTRLEEQLRRIEKALEEHDGKWRQRLSEEGPSGH